MKRNYFVCCLIALFGSLQMQAYDFEVDGIFYTVTGDNTVSVDVGTSLYEGVVTIPVTVANGGVEYNVTGIADNAFGYCTGLTSVEFPAGLTEIGKAAFRNCFGLTTVSLPDGVKSVGPSAFFGCKGLTGVNFPAGLTEIASYMFYGCEGLTSVNLSNNITSVGGSAFAGCVGLKNVTIPESLSQIESYTFKGCKGLTSVTIPANVKNVGDAAFQNCTGLTSATISEGVVQIGRATFEGCTGLSSLAIPSSVKALVSSSFGGCKNLTSITVADGNTVYDSRNNCNAIIETYVEKKQNESVTHYKLVAGCKTSTIPEGVTEIGTNAFLNCNGLTQAVIPASVTLIGASAFQGTGITTIAVPESVTSIEDYCFSDCDKLTTVTLPASVTKIGDGAFAYCTALKEFYCYAEKCPTAFSDAFTSTPVEDATLYVPEASVGAYTLAEPWSLFGAIVSVDGNLVAPEKDSETAIASLQGAGNVQQVYTIGGQQSAKLQRGINIVRMSDGTTRKVLVK